MSKFFLALIVLFSSEALTGTLTVEDLASAPDEPNPVCRSASGTLANCTPTAGVAKQYLSPIVKDANGQILGTLAGLSSPSEGVRYFVQTSLGYTYGVRVTGRIEAHLGVYFSDIDCGGDAFFPVHSIAPGWAAWGYIPFTATEQIWYVPKNMDPSSITVQSSAPAIGPCNNSESTLELVPTFPNDPAITGIPNSPTIYPAPITIDRP